MDKIIAFPAWKDYSPQDIKDYLIKSAIAHRKADRFIRGFYNAQGDNTKFEGGCAIGCTNKDLMKLKGKEWMFSSHRKIEEHTGLPYQVAVSVDHFFERLPLKHGTRLTQQVWEAIEPGSNLSKVSHLFTEWLLTNKKWGVANFFKEPFLDHVVTISRLLRIETKRPLTDPEIHLGDIASANLSGPELNEHLYINHSWTDRGRYGATGGILLLTTINAWADTDKINTRNRDTFILTARDKLLSILKKQKSKS